MFCEAPAMSAGRSKSRSEVVASCIVSPLRVSSRCRSPGVATNGAGTRNGPVGRKPGAFLPRYQSVPISFMSSRKTRSRVVTSFTIV